MTVDWVTDSGSADRLQQNPLLLRSERITRYDTMRRFMIAGWLLLPVGAWAYHEGPGQDGVQLDLVDAELSAAREAAEAKDWALAVEHYDAALKSLPGLDTPALEHSARRIRLSAAKAKLAELDIEIAAAEEQLAKKKGARAEQAKDEESAATDQVCCWHSIPLPYLSG